MKLTKILYVIVREFNIFSLPGFRKFRNWAYGKYLGVKGLNVDRGVRIQKLHRRSESQIAIGHSLHVGANCLIDLSGSVRIGDRVTLSEGAKVFSHTHQIDNGPQDWRKNKIDIWQYINWR